MKRKELYEQVIDYFERSMPVAETELIYSSPYELLVAVILSAQCTDKRVNQITPGFFEAYPTPESLARQTPEKVFEHIKSCSYPNNKSKHLVGMAKVLETEFEGEVPNTLEELQRLPGVGRKTANVILSVVFEKPAMAVDTHVFRVAERIGLTRGSKTPLETEMQLVRYIPEKLIHKAHHWLILHGRYTCMARTPKCSQCGLQHLCRYYAQRNKSSK